VAETEAAQAGLFGREVGHFEQGGRHFDESPSMRALEAAMLPVVIVGCALGGDPTFGRYAAEVAENPSSAHGLAISYCKRGAGTRAVEAMLLEASRDPRPALMATRLMNMGARNAVFLEAPLEPGDRRNAIQARTIATFQRGAELLVRRGSGQCFTCGAILARDGTGDYCAAHAGQPKWNGEEERDRHALRATLRALAEHLAIPASGPASRRRRQLAR